VQHPKFEWTKDVPLLVRAMALAGPTLFIAGPPDFVDEEKSFQGLTQRDPQTVRRLEEQNEALEGARGGILRAVAAADGQTLFELTIDGVPAWDAMAAAGGRLYLATTDGRVLCFEGRR
jgi:hypothetical protein